MIWRTVCERRRIGDSADCVAIQPPPSATAMMSSVTLPRTARNRASSSSALFAALSHLDQRSVAEPRRLELESRGIPALRIAQDLDLDAAIDHADIQPLRRGRLLGLNRPGQEPNPPRTYAAAYSPTLLRRI